MAKFTDEQIARLPYQTTPAKSEDVIKELVNLFVSLTGVFIGSADPTHAVRLIDDPKSEVGQMILIRKMRLGLALDSWASDVAAENVKILGSVLEEHGLL